MPPVVLSHLRGLPAICCPDFPRCSHLLGVGEGSSPRVVCLFQNYVCAKDLPESCVRVSASMEDGRSSFLGTQGLTRDSTPEPGRKSFLGSWDFICPPLSGPAVRTTKIAFKLIANGAWLRGSNKWLIVHDLMISVLQFTSSSVDNRCLQKGAHSTGELGWGKEVLKGKNR